MSIKIKPSHRGRFSRWAKKHHMSVSTAASHVMSHKGEYPASVIKMANFAKNFGHKRKKYGDGGKVPVLQEGFFPENNTGIDKLPQIQYQQNYNWALNKMKTDPHGLLDYTYQLANLAKQGNANAQQELTAYVNAYRSKSKKALGGMVYALGGNVPVEVEGGEAAETPNGQVMQFNGASHEQGGIDVNLPQGTSVYSDRLSVDGKTMAERKKSRERAEAKLQKILDKRPLDKLTKASLSRIKEINADEEQHDMILQQVAQRLAARKQATNKNTSSNPSNVDPQSAGNAPKLAYGTDDVGTLPIGSNGLFDDGVAPTPMTGVNVPNSSMGDLGSVNNFNPKTPFTTGNMLGMAGTLFNAIAPILVTKADRKATLPTMNRYNDFASRALDEMDTSIGTYQKARNNELDDIYSNNIAAINRNNQGSQSINIARASNTAVGLETNKALTKSYSDYAGNISRLLKEKADYSVSRDLYRDNASTAIDQINQRNIDNYYSNLSSNLANAGHSFQTLGKDFNTQKQSDDVLALLPQLSKYGLGISYDKNGRPILSNS
jgi:hypothetical protein